MFRTGEEQPIIHVQHISNRAGATYFLPNTDGINFHKNVMPLVDETIIEKHFPNSFQETTIEASKVNGVFMTVLGSVYAKILSSEEIISKL